MSLDPKDAIGMTYEQAVRLNIPWGGLHPVLDPGSHLIKGLAEPDATGYVHVNVKADGSLEVAADHDGYDACLTEDEAEEAGFVKGADGHWTRA